MLKFTSFHRILAAVFVACIVSNVFSLDTAIDDQVDDTDREGRLSFFSGKLNDDDCGGTNNVNGTCTTAKRCKRASGERMGKCGNGYGVCCRIIANCTAGSTSRIVTNGTRISLKQNENGRCMYYLQRPRGVQQVKLEFVETSRLANPDENGDCNTDSFTVVSGTSTVDSLRVCGNLTGQHMYLDYGDADRIYISLVKTSPDSLIEVKVTFLSLRTVPASCLQYYTDSVNTMKSFGYPNQLNNQMYTICIDSEVVGNIEIKQCSDTNGFLVSGQSADPQGPSSDCTDNSDWIQIFGRQRACGSSFNPVQTGDRPYVIRVNFNDRELIDIADIFPAVAGSVCPMCFQLPNEPNPNVTATQTTCIYQPDPTMTEFCNNLLNSIPEDIANTGFCLQFNRV